MPLRAHYTLPRTELPTPLLPSMPLRACYPIPGTGFPITLLVCPAHWQADVGVC